MNVETGTVLRVGPHWLACGDLEQGHGAQLLQLVAHAPDVVYVDPPWNQGKVSAFRKLADYSSQPSFASFVRDLFKLMVASGSPGFWVEMGDQNQQFVSQWAENAGLHHAGAWKVKYGKNFSWINWIDRGKPNGPAPVEDLGAVGLALPVWAIEKSTQPGGYVFDPCLGLGATALACAIAGRVCIGLELGPTRLTEAAARLSKKLGVEPQIVGRLS